jgi:hypothetical protein
MKQIAERLRSYDPAVPSAPMRRVLGAQCSRAASPIVASWVCNGHSGLSASRRCIAQSQLQDAKLLRQCKARSGIAAGSSSLVVASAPMFS